MALPGDQVSVQEVTSGLVDPYGWNVEGAVYGATLTRVRNLFSRIRDEILEITLSVGQSLDTGALRYAWKITREREYKVFIPC